MQAHAGGVRPSWCKGVERELTEIESCGAPGCRAGSGRNGWDAIERI